MDRPTTLIRATRWLLGSAVVGSIALHALALAIAVLAFGRHAPAAQEAAVIVFIPPPPPPVEAPPSPPPDPQPPPPLPDFTPAPPEESLAVPDFKSPPPPPPKPVQAAPRPVPPKPQPPRPPVVAAPQPPQPALPTPNPPLLAAPSVAPNWNALVTSWLASHKAYPAEARQRGEEGDVTVRFTVEGDGRVGEVAVVKGSGHADLDSAVMAMLRGATLPAPGAAATRTVRIHFHLND